MSRTRNIKREIKALELRVVEGKTQRETAAELSISERTVARFEARWRSGDRPLPEIQAALWSAFDRETNGWRRLRLLQSLAKVAVAQAEAKEAEATRDLMIRVRRKAQERSKITWKPRHDAHKIHDELCGQPKFQHQDS